MALAQGNSQQATAETTAATAASCPDRVSCCWPAALPVAEDMAGGIRQAETIREQVVMQLFNRLLNRMGLSGKGQGKAAAPVQPVEEAGFSGYIPLSTPPSPTLPLLLTTLVDRCALTSRAAAA